MITVSHPWHGVPPGDQAPRIVNAVIEIPQGSRAKCKAGPTPFHAGTMTVNVAGCFLIGLFCALADKGNLLSPEWRILLTTGFCGGFTTFSTFAYENINLLKSGNLMYFMLYTGASIVLGLLATWLGIVLIKLI